jgi:hypothetical protein
VESNPFLPPETEALPLSHDGEFRAIDGESLARTSFGVIRWCLYLLLAYRFFKLNHSPVATLCLIFLILLPAIIAIALLFSWRHAKWLTSHLPGLPGGERWGGRIARRQDGANIDGYLFVTPDCLVFSRHFWRSEEPRLVIPLLEIVEVEKAAFDLKSRRRISIRLRSGETIEFRTGSPKRWRQALDEMRLLAAQLNSEC